MKFLHISHLNKSFGKAKIINDLSISLDANKTMSILGKSGCGKTTMLKIIAGLIPPDSGDLYLHQQPINEIPASQRNAVYLYQEDLLFPHLNVFENIAFGLRIKKLPSDQISVQVEEMIQNLELTGHQQKMPHQLSGGQRQRVSFGRAIITNPALLLLDEPFGSLDSTTRKNMQEVFKRLSVQYNITSLFVTHDLKEAILMGDEIGYMDAGNLKIYQQKRDFIEDQNTGVSNEIDFWKNLLKETSDNTIIR